MNPPGIYEFWYAVIGMGLCVPVFVHYAMRAIRAGIPELRRSTATVLAAASKDLAEAKRILGSLKRRS